MTAPVRLAPLAGALAGLAGCAVANNVDVCGRTPSFEDEINVLTDGNQSTRSTKAVVPLPTGRAFVTFVSSVGEDRQAARGILVDVDGAPVNTCGEPNEVTYSAFRANGPIDQRAAFPRYAAPRTAEEEGFLAWSFLDGDLDGPVSAFDTRIEGRFVGPDGCVVFPEEQPDPLVFDDPPRGRIVGAPAIVHTGDDRFVLLWPRSASGVGQQDGGTLAQVFVEGPFGRARFEPVRDPQSGEAVDGTEPVQLLAGSGSGVDAVPVGTGRFAVVVQDLQIPDQVLSFGIFENTLDEVVPFRVLDRDRGTSNAISPALALDPVTERFLVVWSRSDPLNADLERVAAMLLDRDGNPVGTRHVESGEPFYLTEAVRVQSDPTVSALPGGAGFLVAWSDANDAESEDAIRAALIEPNGDVAFANGPCDRTDFIVHGDLSGAQEVPAVAVFDDGTVMIAWTDRGQNGRDVSGTSVRLQRGDLRTYLPLR
ncbi:MAG: hypothetical protein ACFCGT_04675 [Sandaracinaceae bacterium]